MHLVLINVDYRTLFQTDTCVYAGNMNSCSSTEKLRYATTHQTLQKKLKLYYSAGWPEGKSGKDGIVIVTGAETERTGIQFPHLPVGGWSKHTLHSDSVTVRWSLNLQLVTCPPSRATPQTLRLFTWEIRTQQPMCPKIRNSAFLQ